MAHFAPCNGFAGALRSAQRLMGLYPLWRRGCGDVFSQPAKSSTVAPEHQGRKACNAGAAVEVQLNTTEGGIACNRHLYLCVGAVGFRGFNGSRAFLQHVQQVFKLGPKAEAPRSGDTPQGLRGGAENNPIKSVRMSHTPAVPPHPRATADDIGSGVIQAQERKYHKRFLMVVQS